MSGLYMPEAEKQVVDRELTVFMQETGRETLGVDDFLAAMRWETDRWVTTEYADAKQWAAETDTAEEVRIISFTVSKSQMPVAVRPTPEILVF